MFKKALSVLSMALVSGAAFAQDEAAHAVAGASSWESTSIKAGCYFLAVAIAAYAGTTAQSRAASVALEGIARNPSASDKIVTPMILGLALMESLVIFTLISVFLI